MERVGKGMKVEGEQGDKRVQENKRESKRERRGQAPPLIVDWAYLAVAR